MDSGYSCMECGHKFRTIKAVQKASFGDRGCPKCGGSDIDLHRSSTQKLCCPPEDVRTT